MFANPYQQINERFDQIEALLQEIKADRLARQSTSNPNQRLSRKDVRREYNVSLATIHKLMRLKQLAYEKVGRKTLFTRAAVEQCFSSKKR